MMMKLYHELLLRRQVEMLCLLVVLPLAFSDLASDRATLVAFRASVGGRPLLLWNFSDATPCSWVGVNCTQTGVYELRLPAMGLAGHLPLGLGNLTELQTLSLRFNSLSGQLPADFSNLHNLRNLYLHGNSFSGEIPAFLSTLQNLVRLNLANNNFSGEIPIGFNNLTRLATLYLESNHLSGPIPLLNISTLVQFNISYNQLNGSVPLKLSFFPDTAFAGNSLCGQPLSPCIKPKKKFSSGAIAGIVIGVFFGFIILLIILFLLCKKSKGSREKQKSRSKEMSPALTESAKDGPREKSVGPGVGSSDSMSVEYSGLVKGKLKSGIVNKSLVFVGNTPKVFDLDDLLRASAEVLGKGTFGTAYKATLEVGVAMAIKRLKDVVVSEKEFRDKIEEVGRMNHESLVPLRAYYYNTDEKLLVFDYMPMGSLSALLHGREAGRTPLNWEARSGIALRAARGISYLHSHMMSHGNIKSSNILLDKSYQACVSDFGLSKLASPTVTPNRIAGYRAPEVTDPHKVTEKSDIYSFGVLLLELLTGRAPTYSILNEEGVDLPRWVQSMVQEEWTSEVFDIELLRYQNVEEEMVQLLQLALQCTAPYQDNRPLMDEVVRRIEEICRSSLEKEQEIMNSSSTIDNNGVSPMFYSADSNVVLPS